MHDEVSIIDKKQKQESINCLQFLPKAQLSCLSLVDFRFQMLYNSDLSEGNLRSQVCNAAYPPTVSTKPFHLTCTQSGVAQGVIVRFFKLALGGGASDMSRDTKLCHML